MKTTIYQKRVNIKSDYFRMIGTGLTDINDLDLSDKIVTLDLTDNKLTDFLDFPENSNIETLILDRNPILSFKGFPKMPKLTSLSLQETPVSKLQNFRSLAYIAVGPQLKTLNGLEITKADISTANTYGDPQYTINLVRQGWLPKRPSYTNDMKPIAISDVSGKSSKKTKTKQTTPSTKKSLVSRASKRKEDTFKKQKEQVDGNQLTRVLNILDSQKNDPISVRAVRILRAIGMTHEAIKEFIKNFFSPVIQAKKQPKLKKKEIDPNSLEGQIEKQKETIHLLATQLCTIRSQNRNFVAYDQMINEIAGPLFENQRIVEEDKLRAQHALDESYLSQQTQQKSQNVTQMSFVKQEKKEKKDQYVELRKTLIQYLRTTPEKNDNELIELLEDLNDIEEEDFEEEEGNFAEEEDFIEEEQIREELDANEVFIEEEDDEEEKYEKNEAEEEKLEQKQEEGEKTEQKEVNNEEKHEENIEENEEEEEINDDFVPEEEDEPDLADDLAEINQYLQDINEEEEDELDLDDIGIVLKSPEE